MNKHFSKGFTLIELLVVIAIIGILASVVLASLNTARDKGADAKIKAELANSRSQAQIYYEANTASFYVDAATNVCTSTTGVYNFLQSASAVTVSSPIINGTQTATGNGNCNAYTEGWVIQVPLKVQNQVGSASGQDYYCVDSAGASKVEDLPLANYVLDTGVDPAVATPLSCL